MNKVDFECHYGWQDKTKKPCKNKPVKVRERVYSLYCSKHQEK